MPRRPGCTICAIVRDEQRGISEWMAYQKLIGADYLLLYDNGSSDRTVELIARASRADSSISYLHWPDSPSRPSPQIQAYNDALQRARTEWVAFFDADEFLALEVAESLPAFLAGFGPEVGAVAVNWKVFGSGGRVEPGAGLVIERFVQRAPDHHINANYCKSIVRPEAVQAMRVHVADLRQGHYADATGTPTQIDRACRTARKIQHTAVLHHYALKSRSEFLEKVARGRADKPRAEQSAENYRLDPSYWAALDLNDVEDTTLARRRDDVLAMMAKLDLSSC